MSGAPTHSPLTHADRALLAASAAYLFVAPASGSSGLRTAFALIAAGILAFTLRGALLAQLASIPRLVRHAALAWIAIAIASIAWSGQPRFSLGEVRAEVGYGVLGFVVFFLAAQRLARWRAWWLALIAGSVGVLALDLLQDLAGLRLSRHPMDGGPGPWSTHLVLIAPLLLAIVWPAPWGFERGGFAKALALVLLLAAAALTGNRIVWAALGAQLAVLLIVSRATPAMPAERASTLRRLALLAAVGLVIGFAASVLERNAEFFRNNPSMTASIDNDLRPRLWSTAWDEFRKSPWIGHGFGRTILRDRFLPLTPAKVNHPPMEHAHNAFVDAALQVGVLGLAALGVLFFALAREYARFLRDARVAPWGVIGLATIAGFVVKNLTDDFFYRHNALVFWAINGILLGLASSLRPPRPASA